MQTRLISILSALLIATGLNGCVSATQGKSAEEAGRQALTQLAGQPAYNFEGSGRVTGIQLSSKQDKDAKSENDSIEALAKAFSIEISGAWDLPNKRMEMIPLVRFDQRNLQGMMRFPFIIDANPKTRVLVDPDAFSLFLDGLKPYKDKYVQVPDSLFLLMGDPFDPAKREQAKKIYADIEPQSFSYQPLNDLDKKWGASSKIRIELNQKQLSTLICRAIAIQLNTTGQKKNSDEGDDIAGCQGAGDLLGGIGAEMLKKFHIDLGVDSQGRTRSLQMTADMGLSPEKMNMSMVFNIHMFNFDHPSFTLNPTDAQIAQIDPEMTLSELLGGHHPEISDDIDTPPVHKKPAGKHKKPARSKR